MVGFRRVAFGAEIVPQTKLVQGMQDSVISGRDSLLRSGKARRRQRYQVRLIAWTVPRLVASAQHMPDELVRVIEPDRVAAQQPAHPPTRFAPGVSTTM